MKIKSNELTQSVFKISVFQYTNHKTQHIYIYTLKITANHHLHSHIYFFHIAPTHVAAHTFNKTLLFFLKKPLKSLCKHLFLNFLFMKKKKKKNFLFYIIF